MKKVFGIVALAIVFTCCTFAFEGEKTGVIDKSSPEFMNTVNRLAAFLSTQPESVNKMENPNQYVGSEYCISCHAVERSYMANFPATKHMTSLKRPMAMYSMVQNKGVIADYDGNGVDDFMDGLDFNTISSVFDKYKPNAPILSFENDTYYITIGELKMAVVIVHGGNNGEWKQRYQVRVPVTDTDDGLTAGNYITPVQFNLETGLYADYHGSDWYDGDNNPKFDLTSTASEVAQNNSRNFTKGCIGCHTPGWKSIYADENGEYVMDPYPASLYYEDDPAYLDYNHDGIMDIVNVHCESCHGAGGNHILAMGDPEEIVNPGDLTTKQRNDICGQCHVRPKSVPNGTHGFPVNDDTYERWVPGSEEPIENYMTDNGGYWGDGVHSTKHHQQWHDFYKSSKPEFVFHQVNCSECHYSHSNHDNHQIRARITEEMDDGSELRISTAVDNNTLCLACHATHGDFEEITKEQVAEYDTNVDHIAKVVAAHTNHPYAPERMMGLSKCVDCHMPYVTKTAVAYDIRSHVFEVITPEKTLEYNMPNSCGVSCHNTKVNMFGLGLDDDISAWGSEFDTNSANELLKYYGSGGMWWDTDAEAEHKFNRFIKK